MLSGMKFDPGSAEAPRDMEHAIGQSRSPVSQQKADSVRQKIPFSWAKETSGFQHNHKLQHSFGQPYFEPRRELRPTGSAGQVIQPKSLENFKNSRPMENNSGDDELVKHMSNLPGFLQRVEKETSTQEKALNFGVLEWKRLEKWKYTERMPGKSLSKTLVSRNSFCSTSGLPKVDPNLRKQSASRVCSPCSLYSGKQPSPQGSRLSSPQRQSLHLLHSSQGNANCHKVEKYVGQIKSKGKERCHLEFDSQRGPIGKEEHHFQAVQFFNQSSGMNVEKSINNDIKKGVSERKVSSSSGLGKHRLPTSLPNKINAPGEKGVMQSDDEMKPMTKCCSTEPQNIVLLVPKHCSDNSCSESPLFTESRTSLSEQSSDITDIRLFNFMQEQNSCPLPSTATIHDECDTKPRNLATSEGSELDIGRKACQSMSSSTPIISKGKFSMMHKRTASSSVVDATNKTQASTGKQPVMRGRALSPTPRFSFDLGKMSRNVSIKESSPASQLNATCPTVKPGQVKPEVPSRTVNFEKEMENASSRVRSSPLRRLLDPLLKSKGAQYTEGVRSPSKSSQSATLRTMRTTGQCRDTKPDASTFQALLQLTSKNGLPFFKLVVDNSEDMLAAAAKWLPTSGKSDPCLIFSFYSVHEIRKKSGNWIIQGLKTKTCSLGYDIVGQMKISNSSLPKVKSAESGECNVKECVLYGIGPGQVGKQTAPEFVPDNEIAAIIVNNSSGKLGDGASAPTVEPPVVILPGGIHSTPLKGSTSSLISRWRSGGLCDCGGWDVGCKLRILTVHKKTFHQASRSNINRLNLFQQGMDKPTFSLEPLSNGLYSMELDASISLLEAFATCVAYVTCRKFTEIIDDVRGQSGGIAGTDKTKTLTKSREQLEHRIYMSPAGRI